MRLLVVSDVHGNLSALKAVLKAARKEGYDEALCLGDVVGYGPEPDECVDLVFKECSVVLAGNHDIAAVGGMDITAFSTHARRAMEWTRSKLSQETIRLIGLLEPIRDYSNLLLSHGSPEDPVWSYLLSHDDAEAAFDARPFSTCLFGHTHIPTTFLKTSRDSDCAVIYGTPDLEVPTGKARALINPGSVGFPRDAADAHSSDNLSAAVARYGLLDTVTGLWSFRRVEYDMRSTAELMGRDGLWQRSSGAVN